MLNCLQKSNLLKQLDWQEIAVKYVQRPGTVGEFIVSELSPVWVYSEHVYGCAPS